MARVQRPDIDIQHILHLCHKGSIGLGRNTPFLVHPRFELVFFRSCRTVSGASVSRSVRSTNLSLSKRKVQRLWPSGGGLQVRATRCASWWPSTLRTRGGDRKSVV